MQQPALVISPYPVTEGHHAFTVFVMIFYFFCVLEKLKQKMQPRDCGRNACVDYSAYAVGHKVFAMLLT
jgi:hypothetical protein